LEQIGDDSDAGFSGLTINLYRNWDLEQVITTQRAALLGF